MSATSFSPPLGGIHHITAITTGPQANIDFYSGVLGLRLIKVTVNFDDPGSYHLYYGDDLGRPGTVLTFFAWPGARHGRQGPSQVTAVAFAIPRDAFDFWVRRLNEHKVQVQEIGERFGEPTLAFRDPDGLHLELAAAPIPRTNLRDSGPVPAKFSILGFRGATLSLEGYEGTARLLTETWGFEPHGSEGNFFRYRTPAGDTFESVIDLLCAPSAQRGVIGPGTIHHIAFRTPDDAAQLHWREKIVRLGADVTPVVDRQYFHSIYFREPGGVLFEVATETPGFLVDESLEELGTSVKLPPWLEPHRKELQRLLPPLQLPEPLHLNLVQNA